MADAPKDKQPDSQTTVFSSDGGQRINKDAAQTRSYGYDDLPKTEPVKDTSRSTVEEVTENTILMTKLQLMDVQYKLLTAAGINPARHDPNMLFNGLAIAGTSAVGAKTYSIIKNSNIFDPREVMARQLLSQGHASVDDILRTSYGEWPPKGLDIIGQNDQRVKFISVNDPAHLSPNIFRRTYEQVKNAAMIGGWATTGDERKIAINKVATIYQPGLLGQSGLVTTMGHEVTHSLQGDHYWRAEEVFGRENARTIWAAQNNAASNMITQPIFDEHLSPFRAYRGTYLREGIEIQARMHEVLKDGYQKWGTMPQNREQLIVALDNVGLRPPKEVMTKLNKSPTIEETRKIFASEKATSSGPALDLRIATSTLKPEGKVKFWNEAVPSLYSDLIEMYGDKYGRERFGLGQNPWAPIRESLNTVAPPQPTVHPGPPKAIEINAVKAAENAGESFHGGKGVRGGLLVNTAIGAGAGIIALGMGKDLKESGKISFQIAVPYGETALKISEGDKDGAVHSAMTETAGLAGAMAGAAAGGMAGAALGSFVPVIGTAVVGTIGAVVGGVAGAFGAGIGTDVLLTKVPEITETVTKGVDATMAAFSSDTVTVKTAAPSPDSGEIIDQKQEDLMQYSGFNSIAYKGQVRNIADILRDTSQRKDFIDSLERTAKTSQNPDVKSNIESLLKLSRKFIALEEKRPQTEEKRADKSALRDNFSDSVEGTGKTSKTPEANTSASVKFIQNINWQQ